MLHLFPYFGTSFCLFLSFFSILRSLKGLISKRWDQLFYKRKEKFMYLRRNNLMHQSILENTMETTDGNHLCTTVGSWWAWSWTWSSNVCLQQRGKWCPEPHQAEHCQQDEGGDPSFLVSAGGDTSAMLYPVLGCQKQERHGHIPDRVQQRAVKMIKAMP